jgi:outer membrane protein OmpU
MLWQRCIINCIVGACTFAALAKIRPKDQNTLNLSSSRVEVHLLILTREKIMKKILLTTTALVAFAGAAAAEVSISGYAEMGINGGTGQEAELFQDIDVTFAMSGETDGGLSFGASVDLDETTAGTTTDNDHGTTVNISGAFGTLTMGDTDGAMDWALTEAGNMGNPGSIGDDETSHVGYFGSYHDGSYDGQIVRYNNTFGDFGVAISAEQDDDTTTGVAGDGQRRDTGYALGLRYSLTAGSTDIALGLGFQSVDLGAVDGDKEEIVGLSAVATMASGFTAGLSYVSGDILGVEDSSHIGVGVGYTTGAFSMHANYGAFDLKDVAVSTGFGLSAKYDLGGGASVVAGYGQGTIDSDIAGVDDIDNDTFSLGLALSF